MRCYHVEWRDAMTRRLELPRQRWKLTMTTRQVTPHWESWRNEAYNVVHLLAYKVEHLTSTVGYYNVEISDWHCFDGNWPLSRSRWSSDNVFTCLVSMPIENFPAAITAVHSSVSDVGSNPCFSPGFCYVSPGLLQLTAGWHRRCPCSSPPVSSGRCSSFGHRGRDWLPVRKRVVFEAAVLAWKCLWWSHELIGGFLFWLLWQKVVNGCTLLCPAIWWSRELRLLSVSGPSLCSAFDVEQAACRPPLRSMGMTYQTFRHKLNTYLFQQ